MKKSTQKTLIILTLLAVTVVMYFLVSQTMFGLPYEKNVTFLGYNFVAESDRSFDGFIGKVCSPCNSLCSGTTTPYYINNITDNTITTAAFVTFTRCGSGSSSPNTDLTKTTDRLVSTNMNINFSTLRELSFIYTTISSYSVDRGASIKLGSSSVYLRDESGTQYPLFIGDNVGNPTLLKISKIEGTNDFILRKNDATQLFIIPKDKLYQLYIYTQTYDTFGDGAFGYSTNLKIDNFKIENIVPVAPIIIEHNNTITVNNTIIVNNTVTVEILKNQTIDCRTLACPGTYICQSDGLCTKEVTTQTTLKIPTIPTYVYIIAGIVFVLGIIVLIKIAKKKK